MGNICAFVFLNLNERKIFMKTSKRWLSAVAAIAMAASSFSALYMSASAEEAQELINEDFSEVTDTWGFTGGGGQAIDTANGYLQITTNNAAGKESVKTLDEAVSEAEFLDIKFDWASNVENSKDRISYFVLRDSDNKVFFGMYGMGNRKANGIQYTTSGDPDWTVIETQTPGKFYTIDIDVNFVSSTLSGTISNTSTGDVLVTIPETDIDASNFANMRGYDVYSLAPQLLDNVIVSTQATYATKFMVTSDEDNSPLSGAEIVVGKKTITAGEDGTAEILLANGYYEYTITANGHEIVDSAITVSDAEAEVPVMMEYAGEAEVTSIEIGGGDEGIYKPKSGSNSTVNAYTATVYDQTEQIIDGEEVEWSLVAAAEGASISEDGIVTVTDEFPVADINGETIVVKATSKTNPDVYATANLHVYDIARVTTFDIVGPSALKDGTSATYTIGNVKDQYGVAYTGDATYTLSATGNVTVDGMTVTPNTGTVQTEDFVITATSSDTDYQGNSVTSTKTVTAYAFDFYESQVGGSYYGTVRTAEVAGGNYTVWPASSGGTATQTITLPVPVEMAPGSAKLITYSTAWTSKTVSSQERYMTLDFSGDEAKDIRLGYQGGVYLDPAKSNGNFVSDTHLGSQGTASTFEETLIIVKTDIDGNSTATISYAGGTPVVLELGSNIGTLTSLTMTGGKGAPDDRLLAIKDIKISDSDIAEVEIKGSDTVAKISGTVVTKQYEASVFVLADGETFTWSVTDANGLTGNISSKRVFKLAKPAESAVIVSAVYNTDGSLDSVSSTPVTIEADAEYIDAPTATENTEYYLWDSLTSMTPLAKGVTTITEGASDAAITIDQNGVLSVPDTVPAETVVTISYTSDLDASKTASKDVTIKDFSNVESFIINGPATVNAGEAATYSVSDIIDEYGDEVEMKPVYEITSGADIASINSETGVLITDSEKAGTITISVTVGNPGKTKTLTKDVIIGKFSASGETTEATVTVNVAELANYAEDTTYLVTTATADGVLVSQAETASTDGNVTVDMTGAVKYEVSPIYSYTDVGSVAAGKEIPVCDGMYDFTFVKSGNSRGDIYVNDCLVGNNVDQSGKQRVTGGTVYTVKDVKVEGGSAVVRMTDDTDLSLIIVKKAPSILPRKTHVYIAGDSTQCSYNGQFSGDVEIIDGLPRAGQAQTGWGQVFEQFVGDDVNVTNIAESGATAESWYGTLEKGVIEQSQPGDYFIVCFGINDRNRSTVDKMAETLTNMINDCRDAGVIPVLVSTQRYAATYQDALGWEGFFDRVITVAEENDALHVNLTDLITEYYDNKVYNETVANRDFVVQNINVYYGGASQDTTHLSYFGAMKCCEVLAQSIADQQAAGTVTASGESFDGLTINKDVSYTFTLVDDTTETLKVN